MSDDYVYEVGTVTDIDGMVLAVGVDYDTVSFKAPPLPMYSGVRLTIEQAEEFARLFIGACWSAGANSRKIVEDGRDPSPEAEAALDALRAKLAGNG